MSNTSTFLDPNGIIDRLGRLIDQTLDQIDFHQTEATRLSQLVDWHERQAAQHKLIQRELERLIFAEDSEVQL